MERLLHLDAYKDLVCSTEKSKDFDKELAEYERILERSEEMDENLKMVLSYFLKNVRVESSKKQKEKDDDFEHDSDSYDDDDDDSGTDEYDGDSDDSDDDDGNDPQHEFEPREKRRKRENHVCAHDNDFFDEDDDDDENDPQYELFLKSLRKHEKSYTLEYEKNGEWVVLKYEEDSSSDDECDPEPRRILRSAMKQNNAPSRQMPAAENQCNNDSESTETEDTINLTQRRLKNKAKSEITQNVKCTTNEMVPDPDYLAFTQALKIVDDHYVYTHEGHTVVYEMNNGENNQEKKNNHDDSSSDAEIIDSTTFYKETNVHRSMMNEDNSTSQSEFRLRVMTLLRKPFDEGEYDKLSSDVDLRTQKMRHMDLRNGRERSCSARKMGKSYLDYHPDLKRRLAQFEDDKPKRLNILRGFFFWLQNVVQKGSFKPWEDEECLAINPESC